MADKPKATVTAAANIRRVLAELGLAGSVIITKEDEDRVWGWPVGSALLDYAIQHGWTMDVGKAADLMHGTPYSYREPKGVRPALQVCVHPAAISNETDLPYFFEIDLDEASPFGGLGSFFTHAKEVLLNGVTRRKTNQQKISALLDKRFAR